MERREKRERAALPKATATTSGEKGRSEVRAALPEWLPLAGKPVTSLSS
jgi:hypothetical protein